MSASASDIERTLHGDGAFTPTHATAFAVHLKALCESCSAKKHYRSRRSRCVYIAALMDQIKQKTPIARIVMLRDFPICVAKDGT